MSAHRLAVTPWETPAESWQKMLVPDSEHNRELARQVRPPNWVPPVPARRYNLVVIGGGTAGLVTAVGASSLGARVALVEQGLLGGDCLNVGCVPSKAVLHAARVAAEVRRASWLRVAGGGAVESDFARVMERMRAIRAELARNDSAQRLADLGVDVFFEQARFTGPDTVQAGNQELRFARAVIATGARAAVPPISGLDSVPYWTNESVFSMTELPRRLVVLGAGPIGCELGQAFARFGSRVTLVDMAPRILPRDDAEAAAVVTESLLRDGVEIMSEAKVERVERTRGGEISVQVRSARGAAALAADGLLVAVGRAPNIEALDLEAAGVRYDARQGVQVDDFLRSSNPRIYAAGDVCSAFRFTHAADAMARIVIQNALFFGRARVSQLVIPWCTYTDPELAQVGWSEEEARRRGADPHVVRVDFAEVDRAVVDGRAQGFVKVVAHRRSGKVLGATIVGPAAGELAAHLATAVQHGVRLSSFARTVFPYPTLSLAIKRAADQWNRTRLTPRVQWLFSKFLAWRR